MKNNVWLKIFIIVLLIIWAFVYIFPWKSYWINIFTNIKDYKFWLDLQWWVELDYKILLEEARKDPGFDKQKEKSIIEWLKSIVDKRVEKLKINDSVITSATYWWEEHIIVQIPMKWENEKENQENINKAKEAIWKVVKIEFKERRKTITDEDKKERKELARQIIKDLKSSKDPFVSIAQQYKDNYENIDFWVFSWTKSELNSFFQFEENIKNWIFDDIVSWTWKTMYWIDEKWQLIPTSSWEEWYYVLDFLWKENNSQTWSTWSIFSFNYVFLTKMPSEWISAKDKKWRILNDQYFVSSTVTTNELFQPRVQLTFNSEWAKIFYELTERLKWEQIAIFVWWNLLTAPTVNEAIPSWEAVITWNYTMEEARELSQNINTWVVPAPIYLTSEKTIDSKLWTNSLQKLIVAWFIWFLLIFTFLIYIYRASWFMSSLALVIYVLLLLFIIKFFQIVLTLASIAWLILSIWMAIDANILIFERTKEELRTWKKLDEALKVGFKKSFSAIWDTHLTWLITAIILFIFGINMIKWFWLILWIWLIVSLFTAMYISRMFIFWLSKTWIKQKNFIWKV